MNSISIQLIFQEFDTDDQQNQKIYEQEQPSNSNSDDDSNDSRNSYLFSKHIK